MWGHLSGLWWGVQSLKHVLTADARPQRVRKELKASAWLMACRSRHGFVGCHVAMGSRRAQVLSHCCPSHGS